MALLPLAVWEVAWGVRRVHNKHTTYSLPSSPTQQQQQEKKEKKLALETNERKLYG
jgi:hypothetical protein